MPIRIAYSCVVDRTPKLYWEILLWMDTLIEIAGISASDLFVHAVKGVDEEICAEIKARGCHLAFIETFDRRHLESNKLQQFFAKTFAGYDAIAFVDTDMEVVRPYDDADFDPATIAGTAIFKAYQEDVWKRLLGREEFETTPSTLNIHRSTYRNHLSGGIYLAPIGLIDEFGQRTRAIAREGLDGVRDWNATEREVNADEIATALALDQMGLLAKLLRFKKNLPPQFLNRGDPFYVVHGTSKLMGKFYTAEGIHRRPAQTQADTLLVPLDEITLRVNRHSLGKPYHHYRAMMIHMELGEGELAVREAEQASELWLGAREYRDVISTLTKFGQTDRAQILFARLGSEGKLL